MEHTDSIEDFFFYFCLARKRKNALFIVWAFHNSLSLKLKICTVTFEWELFAFQFCFDFLQLAPWICGLLKTCWLGTTDGLCYWPQNARLIFFLLEKYFTAVHIIKVSVIRHLYVQIQIRALGSWSDPDDWMFWYMLDASLVYLRLWEIWPWYSVFSVFGFRQILIACCCLDESKVSLT